MDQQSKILGKSFGQRRFFTPLIGTQIKYLVGETGHFSHSPRVAEPLVTLHATVRELTVALRDTFGKNLLGSLRLIDFVLGLDAAPFLLPLLRTFFFWPRASWRFSSSRMEKASSSLVVEPPSFFSSSSMRCFAVRSSKTVASSC